MAPSTVTAHLLGTYRMGSDPESSVVGTGVTSVLLPTLVLANMSAGEAYQGCEQDPAIAVEARECWRMARDQFDSVIRRLTPVASAPTNVEALEPLATALALVGRPDEAIQLVERLQEMGYRIPEIDRIRRIARGVVG